MAEGSTVAVTTTDQRVVTGLVQSNEHNRSDRPVEVINDAQFAFVINGQRVHVGHIVSVSKR